MPACVGNVTKDVLQDAPSAIRFNGAKQAAVIIDRATGLITVRPYRQHKSYTLPLADIAEGIVCRCIKADLMVNKPVKKFLAKRGTF